MLPMAMANMASARDYVAGQLWSYKTRPGDESSTLLIDLVESVPKLGTIYHISVLRVQMPSLKDNSRGIMDLPHFPVSRETLDKSALELVGTREPFEPYRNGYAEWRKAFDEGHAGIFTLTVADIVGAVESIVIKNRAQLMKERTEPPPGH